MKTIDFETVVRNHSLKPENLLYNSNALCGEVGEVANTIKKIEIRKALKPHEVFSMNTMGDYFQSLDDELGDALFYLTRVAIDSGRNLDAIMRFQVLKLEKQSKKYDRNFLK